MSNVKKFVKLHREAVLFVLIFTLAALVRLVMFCDHPAGLNQDEASIGYDAWALMNFGIDRNGFSLPVQLVAWGSGQNVLYAYLSIPFIAVFGLNVFSVRIVNLLFSLITVVAAYGTVKRWKGKRTGFIAMTMVAAAPWNIMLARWGLESNVFPALLMLSIWALLKSTEKPRFFIVAAVILSLSLYSYGSAYLVITLFSLACFVYFIIKKLVPLRYLVIGAAVYALISLPIYLFMLVNVFQLDTIRLGALSIPRLNGNRIDAQSGATLSDFFRNFFRLGIEQTDLIERNAFPFYGSFYVISLPFWLLGIYKCARSRKGFDIVLLMSLVFSVLLFGYYNSPNINRVNAIYIPLILLTAVGIGDFADCRRSFAAIFLAYSMCFCGFCFTYFGENYRVSMSREFYSGFGEAIEAADDIAQDGRTVYITNNVNMPYIYTLFYTQTPPDEYISTAKFANKGSMFEIVTSFSNYVFNTDGAEKGESGVYVLEASRRELVAQKTSDIRFFDNYIVAVIP